MMFLVRIAGRIHTHTHGFSNGSIRQLVAMILMSMITVLVMKPTKSKQ